MAWRLTCLDCVSRPRAIGSGTPFVDRRHDPVRLLFGMRELAPQAGERSREPDPSPAIPDPSSLTTPTGDFGSAPPAGAHE
jgi:hypothetical protein